MYLSYNLSTAALECSGSLQEGALWKIKPTCKEEYKYENENWFLEKWDNMLVQWCRDVLQNDGFCMFPFK